MLEPGFYNMDCMEALKDFPDGYFDIAICDPPYGKGNVDNGGGVLGEIRRQVRPLSRRGGHYTNGRRKKNSTYAEFMRTAGEQKKKIIAWDTAPEQSFFDELFRVSRNQIIWGGNYFNLPPTRCFIVWDKKMPEDFSMAMAEYAWTSFDTNAKIFYHVPNGTPSNPRIHPTQKPIKLYEWLLKLYAQPGYKILDPMAGSGSCVIACRNAGYDCTAFEIDPDYFTQAQARIQSESAQANIFDYL